MDKQKKQIITVSNDFSWKRFLTDLWHVLLGVIILISMISFNGSSNIIEAASNRFAIAEYNVVAYPHYDDPVIDEIVDFCGGFYEPNPYNKSYMVDCVVMQVSEFYNYSSHPKTIKGGFEVRSPSEYKENGGVCRDIAVLYAITFRRLGWTVQYSFPEPRHVNVIINKGGTWCYIDGLIYKCHV
jgi:hypothetical protein